jgi:hypothetical protein
MAAAKLISATAVAVCAATLTIAGCGGGGGSSSSTTSTGEPLTKQDLVAKGDAICKQALGQFQQLQQNPPTTAEGFAALTQKLIDISDNELNQLRDLTPPASLQSSLDAYLKSLEKNIAVLKQGLKAAQQSDATAFAKAQAKTVSTQVERLQLARAVGFKECSRPAGTASGTSGG